MEFAEWFTQQMSQIGYGRSHTHDEIASQWMNFTDGHEDFHVMYLHAPMTPEAIRITFASHNFPVLFVVDVKSVDFSKPMTDFLWLTALHAIYYGRVYIFTEYEAGIPSIRAVHFDREKQQYSSEVVDLSGILFTDTDCKLRDFPGVFHIARFYDKAFWVGTQHPKEDTNPPKRKKPRSNPNESFWKEEWARQNNTPPKEDDIFEAFKRAFEEQMRRAQASQQQTYNQTPNRYAPTGDKWLQQFIATGSLAAAKTMYRQLSKLHHPDLNPGDTVAEETFKAISVAFAKARDILR